MPTVSIVLPTYNRAEYLPRSIDSVLRQTFDDFELIVVDDASTDGTRSVVEGYDDDRVTYVSHDENRGPSAARNTGLEIVRGEFVTFIDSDDEFVPTFLETSLRALRDEPDDCAGTAVTYENHKTYKDYEVEMNPVPPVMSGMDVIGDAIPRVGGLMLRSTVVSEIGRFDEQQPYNEDVDYWIRLFQNGYYLVGIGEPLYRYYKHGDQQTSDDRSKIFGLTTFFGKHDGALPTSYRVKHRRELGIAYAREGDFSSASAQFRRAIEDESGFSTNYWYYLTARKCPNLLLSTLFAKKVFRFCRRELKSLTARNVG